MNNFFPDGFSRKTAPGYALMLIAVLVLGMIGYRVVRSVVSLVKSDEAVKITIIEPTTSLEIPETTQSVMEVKEDPFCKEPIKFTPQAILKAMDHDLDAIEKGGNACGSFSDYFIPNASDAIRAGASRKAVNARIERAVALAAKGKFLSSYEAEIVRRDGPRAVREYADAVLENVDVLLKEKDR